MQNDAKQVERQFRKDVPYFDKNGDLVCEEIKNYSKRMIPKHHVHIIYWNLKADKTWENCHPMLAVTREEAAFILNNYPGYYY